MAHTTKRCHCIQYRLHLCLDALPCCAVPAEHAPGLAEVGVPEAEEAPVRPVHRRRDHVPQRRRRDILLQVACLRSHSVRNRGRLETFLRLYRFSDFVATIFMFCLHFWTRLGFVCLYVLPFCSRCGGLLAEVLRISFSEMLFAGAC